MQSHERNIEQPRGAHRARGWQPERARYFAEAQSCPKIGGDERADFHARTGYYERKGVAYQVHFPTPYERAWGFGSAKLGQRAQISEQQLAPLEVWSRYRALCAAGQPFDIALSYRGFEADPSVVLALGRLVSGEWARFALCLPAPWEACSTVRLATLNRDIG